jgi:exopolysaccharide biosynthesis polyprenyl glycosylphosphotransferase
MRAERARKGLIQASSVRVPGRAPRWSMPAVYVALLVADAIIAAVCFLGAFYFRLGGPLLGTAEDSSFLWSQRFEPYGALLAFVVVIRLLTFQYYGLYRLRGEFSLLEDSVKIFKATAISSLLIVAAAFLYRGGFQYRTFSYSRSVFLLDFVLVLSSMELLQFLIRSAQGFFRKKGINLIPTVVVGRGPEASLCITEMRERPSLGYRVIGLIESGTLPPHTPETYEGVPVIGTLTDLPEAIRESGANEVIIADPGVNSDLLFDVMMRCGRHRGVEFRIAPTLFNCLPRKTEIDQIGVLPMIKLFREPLSNTARLIKRTSDVTIALLGLLLFAPVWLLVTVLIKLDSKGPVFYVQERVGMDGRIFVVYKFRTMHIGSDEEIHKEYQRKFIAGRAEANLGDAGRPTYKIRNDPRITRVGWVLRRLSLDEVPQLINVLRGDMSVVGPRPPIAYEVEAYELWHRKRLEMKPGLTGLWQVSGRNRLPFEEMVKLDLFYIENWSLLLDLRIIMRTALVIFRGDGY